MHSFLKLFVSKMPPSCSLSRRHPPQRPPPALRVELDDMTFTELLVEYNTQTRTVQGSVGRVLRFTRGSIAHQSSEHLPFNCQLNFVHDFFTVFLVVNFVKRWMVLNGSSIQDQSKYSK